MTSQSSFKIIFHSAANFRPDLFRLSTNMNLIVLILLASLFGTGLSANVDVLDLVNQLAATMAEKRLQEWDEWKVVFGKFFVFATTWSFVGLLLENGLGRWARGRGWHLFTRCQSWNGVTIFGLHCS